MQEQVWLFLLLHSARAPASAVLLFSRTQLQPFLRLNYNPQFLKGNKQCSNNLDDSNERANTSSLDLPS